MSRSENKGGWIYGDRVWGETHEEISRYRMRPYISERLIDAFEAWVGFLNSGPNPMPKGAGICSIWASSGSGKGTRKNGQVIEEIDINLGVKIDDAFRKLMPTQQTCIKTHVLWSCYSPLTGMSTDWPKMREHEARHANLNEETYELNLISAIAELERACG